MNLKYVFVRQWIIVHIFCLTALSSIIAADLPPGFAEVLVADDLDPTAMALAPDGRLFLLEKHGRVLIVENGQLLPDPFLVIEVDNFNERGLSGIAIHPDFATNGYIYLYYTVPGANHNRVSRFTADGNYARPDSEKILLELEPMAGTIHNAGSMSFGPDGKLYISVGDGADAGTSQRLNSLLGKILRINADGSIPADNPFYQQTTGQYRAIWALGFRNSFSMAIQPGTGRIFASEVGNATWEEINDIRKGKNYGWPIIEGPLAGQSPPADYMDPFYAYDHSQGCSAVGAVFYNPLQMLFPAEYRGKFFFADYCRGYIKYVDPDVPGVAHTFATNIDRPLNMVVADDGTMYYLARSGIGGGSMEDNTATNDGSLWRIFYTDNGAPFVSVNPQSVRIPVGEDAAFRTSASGNAPLSYQWQRNGADIPGANEQMYELQSAVLSDDGAVFRCIITNAAGADTTQGAVLYVIDGHRPEPEILLPLPGATYRGGDDLLFQGVAFDQEDGQLPPEALRWKIDFHHDTHTHPGLTPVSGIASGTFAIPQVGETSDNVWYRIYLTATDQSGLTETVSWDIFPEKVQFHVTSDPSGIPVYVDGSFAQTPVTTTSVVGIIREVEAVSSVLSGDSILLFSRWSDGETSPVRSFAAPAQEVTFAAIYEPHPLGEGTGLRGHYFDGPMYDPTFYGAPAFSRIDTTINFEWGGGTPDAERLGDDFWLVRWEGFVEPLFDDDYRFHVISDDGIRLWVADRLIIDQWVPQAPTETVGSIILQGGAQYPIRLEYFEEAGGAVCRLLWSSGRIGRTVIPKSQLYPTMTTSTVEIGNVPVLIYPNPARDLLILESAALGSGLLQWELINALGQVMLSGKENLGSGIQRTELDTHRLSAGTYWLRINMPGIGSAMVKVVKL